MKCIFFFHAEDGIRDLTVTGVQTCALPIFRTKSGAGVIVSASGAVWSGMPEATPRTWRSVNVPVGAFSRTSRSNFEDRKSTRLNYSHSQISYAVVCL